QNESHRAEKRNDRRPKVTRELIPKREHGATPVSVEVRILLSQPGGNGPHLVLGSGQANSRFQPRDHREESSSLLAIGERFREYPRRPHLRLAAGERPFLNKEIEIRRSHSDD